MRVLVVCEGIHENTGALGALICRLNGHVTALDYDRVQNTPRRIHGRGGGYFKRAIGWLMEAERRGYDALVLLIDQDGYDDRIAEFDRAQEHLDQSRLSRALGVAIQTFDAWMLADAKALSQVLGTTIDTQRAPEDIGDPKSRMIQLARDAGKPAGLREVYAAIAAAVRIEELESRCRNGFVPFAERVRTLQRSSGRKDVVHRL
jgi:hypothetical protein